MTFIRKVRQTVEKFGMLRQGDGVLVAVSGGPDSVALLHAMIRLSKPWQLTLAGAYFNHGLRGVESEAEERFVDVLFAVAGVPLHKSRMNPRDGSRGGVGNLEERCREERYRFFDTLKMELGLEKIALGHSRDDLAETVLMHFLRGSGSEGLKGMLPVRDGVYIRPLLEVAREDILLFLEQESLAHVSDSSNQCETFLRNRLRRSLIPELLDKYNPRLLENISRLADILREENDYLNVVAAGLISSWGIGNDGMKALVGIRELQTLHPALQRRVLMKILLQLAHAPRGIGYSHVELVLGLLSNDQTGRSLDLPLDLQAVREYGDLVIRRNSGDTAGGHRGNTSIRGRGQPPRVWDFSFEANIPGTLPLEHLGMNLSFDFVDRSQVSFTRGNQAFLDFEQIDGPLLVRNVRPGDRMTPLGMKGRKKVKDLFIDGKIPRTLRRGLPILVDRQEVLWVPGVRLAQKVRIREATTRVLKVEMI